MSCGDGGWFAPQALHVGEGAVDDAGGIFAGFDEIEGEAEGAECLLMFAGEDGGAIESPLLIREVEVVSGVHVMGDGIDGAVPTHVGRVGIGLQEVEADDIAEAAIGP